MLARSFLGLGLLTASLFVGCAAPKLTARAPSVNLVPRWGRGREVAPQVYERVVHFANGTTRRILSNRPNKTNDPIMLVIDGSGCSSVVAKNPDGSLNARFWGQIDTAFGARYHLVAIEKPGVALFSDTEDGGPDCSAEYQQHATLEDRIQEQELLLSALAAERPDVVGKVVAVGHSEGAVVATFLGQNQTLAAVGVFAGLGPSQGFDFALMFRKRSKGAKPAEVEALVDKSLASMREVLANPTRTDKFIWGHSYRRWASYIAHPSSEALAASRVPIFIAHGSEDSAAQIESFDYLQVEMMRTDKSTLQFRRYPGLNHSFRECPYAEEDCSGKPQRFALVLADFDAWLKAKQR